MLPRSLTECGKAAGLDAPSFSTQHFIPSDCKLSSAIDAVVSLSGAAQQLCSSRQSLYCSAVLSNAMVSASSKGSQHESEETDTQHAKQLSPPSHNIEETRMRHQILAVTGKSWGTRPCRGVADLMTLLPLVVFPTFITLRDALSYSNRDRF